MKTTTAFNALRKRRENERDAKLNFAATSLTKAGKPSKAHNDLRFNGFATREQAEARCEQLASMNPGRQFAVIEL